MIKKITIGGVNSFKKSTCLETDKKVNLIYGLNGSGKTTISDYLSNLDDDKFKLCDIEGFDKSQQKILVYNQKFVRENFYSTNIQSGFRYTTPLLFGASILTPIFDNALDHFQVFNNACVIRHVL